MIGTGSNDPQKFDPGASRETLDHSVMYIFAVALQDGTWQGLPVHSVRSSDYSQQGPAEDLLPER